MMTERQIRAMFAKAHMMKVYNALLQETSEFSKLEGKLRYKPTRLSVDEFMSNVRVTKIDDAHCDSVGIAHWFVTYTYFGSRGNWTNKAEFFTNGKCLGKYAHHVVHTLDEKAIDRYVRDILTVDCLLYDGTAISIGF